MTDADIVRDLLLEMGNGDTTPEEYDAALAALDRLVAERGEAQAALRHFTHGEQTITVGREWMAEREAERDRLRAALERVAPDPLRGFSADLESTEKASASDDAREALKEAPDADA